MMLRRRFLLISAGGVFLASGASAATVPRPSPDFTILLADGGQVRLSDYRGKVVAVLFILTYCPHCQKAVEAFSRLQKEYGPRGFQVLASAIEVGAKPALPGFLKRFQPPFPVGYNTRTQAQEYLQHPAMLRMMMPQVVFVDRKFTVRAQYSGDDAFFIEAQMESNFRRQIEALLDEGSPRRKGARPRPKKGA